jgi:adenylate cyclase
MHSHVSACPISAHDEDVHGAEVELSMLFADIRGSSTLARQMTPLEFGRLMDRFYKVSSEVLIDHDAVIEKFVGDEVVGLFIPFLAGQEHVTRAVDAARALLRAAGYGRQEGPWVPIGAAVHTGRAFVGIVGTSDAPDFTALGDPMNIAAHLAAQAGAGEILVTDAVVAGSPVVGAPLERRHLSLKGFPIDALVVPLEPVDTPAA